MSAAAIVITKLLATSAVTDIVGTRIYPVLAPQGTATPQIIVHIIDNMDGAHLNGANKLYRTIIQLDLNYSADTSGAAGKVIELGEAVIEALNGVIKETIADCTDVDILLGDGDHTDYDLDRNNLRRVIRFAVRWRKSG